MSIGKTRISVSIITFNEETNLSRCLESVGWADEIIVVDSLSKDKTQEIAAKAGARVVEQAFLGYREQKQFALNLCSHEWVLCLDADEYVTPEMRLGIEKAFQSGKHFDGLIFRRLSIHLGRPIRHGGWYPDRKLRLVRKKKARWVGTNPHDKLEVDGKTWRIAANIGHMVFRDLSHNVEANNRYSSIMAGELLRLGKHFNLLKLIFKPPFTFFRLYVLRLGFLDGLPGFIIAVGAAYSQFLKFAKLWELENVVSKKPS